MSNRNPNNISSDNNSRIIVSQQLLEQNEDVIAAVVENLQLGRLDDSIKHFAILKANLISLATELDNFPCTNFSNSNINNLYDLTHMLGSNNAFPDEIMRKDILEDFLPLEQRMLPKPPIIPPCVVCHINKITAQVCRNELNHIEPSHELTSAETEELLHATHLLAARHRQNDLDSVCGNGKAKRIYKRWSDNEKYTLSVALCIYGKDFNQLVHLIETRSDSQIRNFIVKQEDYFNSLNINELLKNPPKGYQPPAELAYVFANPSEVILQQMDMLKSMSASISSNNINSVTLDNNANNSLHFKASQQQSLLQLTHINSLASHSWLEPKPRQGLSDWNSLIGMAAGIMPSQPSIPSIINTENCPNNYNKMIGALPILDSITYNPVAFHANNNSNNNNQNNNQNKNIAPLMPPPKPHTISVETKNNNDYAYTSNNITELNNKGAFSNINSIPSVFITQQNDTKITANDNNNNNFSEFSNLQFDGNTNDILQELESNHLKSPLPSIGKLTKDRNDSINNNNNTDNDHNNNSNNNIMNSINDEYSNLDNIDLNDITSLYTNDGHDKNKIDNNIRTNNNNINGHPTTGNNMILTNTLNNNNNKNNYYDNNNNPLIDTGTPTSNVLLLKSQTQSLSSNHNHHNDNNKKMARDSAPPFAKPGQMRRKQLQKQQQQQSSAIIDNVIAETTYINNNKYNNNVQNNSIISPEIFGNNPNNHNHNNNNISNQYQNNLLMENNKLVQNSQKINILQPKKKSNKTDQIEQTILVNNNNDNNNNTKRPFEFASQFSQNNRVNVSPRDLTPSSGQPVNITSSLVGNNNNIIHDEAVLESNTNQLFQNIFNNDNIHFEKNNNNNLNNDYDAFENVDSSFLFISELQNDHSFM
eukprot:gene5368-7444_t